MKRCHDGTKSWWVMMMLLEGGEGKCRFVDVNNHRWPPCKRARAHARIWMGKPPASKQVVRPARGGSGGEADGPRSGRAGAGGDNVADWAWRGAWLHETASTETRTSAGRPPASVTCKHHLGLFVAHTICMITTFAHLNNSLSPIRMFIACQPPAGSTRLCAGRVWMVTAGRRPTGRVRVSCWWPSSPSRQPQVPIPWLPRRGRPSSPRRPVVVRDVARPSPDVGLGFPIRQAAGATCRCPGDRAGRATATAPAAAAAAAAQEWDRGAAGPGH
jgi:hypothetical protein